MTFAKRYAFCNALGILTGDEDTDGNNTEAEPSVPPPSGSTSVNTRSKILFNLQKLGVTSKEPSDIVAAIKKYTGIDKKDDAEDTLKEINNRLEVLIIEHHEANSL